MMAAVAQFSFVIPPAETRDLAGDLRELFSDLEASLPPELQDGNPRGIWRRVDGAMTQDALPTR